MENSENSTELACLSMVGRDLPMGYKALDPKNITDGKHHKIILNKRDKIENISFDTGASNQVFVRLARTGDVIVPLFNMMELVEYFDIKDNFGNKDFNEVQRCMQIIFR